MKTRVLFLLISLFFSTSLLHSAHSSEVKVHDAQDRYDLVSQFHYLIDPKGTMSFEAIKQADIDGKFIRNSSKSLNFGFSEKTYWIKFTLTGSRDSDNGWFLEFSYPAIDLYTVFIPDKYGNYYTKQIGDSIPFSNWDIPFVRPTIALGHTLPFNQPIYVKVKTTGVVNISATLLSTSQFSKHVGTMKLGFGVYYGIMLALVVYNLFIYFSIRDKNFLLYTVFILFFSTSQITYNGLGFQYLWPSANWFANFSYSFFLAIIFIPMILFAKSFLRIGDYLPKTNKFLTILMIIHGVISVSEPIFGMRLTSSSSAICALVTAHIIYFSAIFIFIRGLRAARFFLIGWTFYLLGLVTLLLKMLGILPHNFVTEYAVQIGSAIEGLLLSLALADRMNIMKKQKEDAQFKALEEMKKSSVIQSQFLENTEKIIEERTKELEFAKNELEQLARKDALTGLFNRRVFDEVYEKEFARATRTGTPFSLLMLDVDFFKLFNDHYGHKKGDDCLQEISRTIEHHASRITDTVARYGGEEFTVILTETDQSTGLNMAEQIREAVEELEIPHIESPYKKVTISIGLTTLNRGNNISQAELFNRVDNALYEAKNSGRNKTAIA